ncbi:FliO/MopB family protein [Arthrobacter sp. L77]|uniref:FliO/MopB family protein n=1 Tax=Arthrobacter sp. L77 TaxID=1496689 RepID=UPI00068F13AC|nr:flagellar biosynthetic protein FliO [Arthrobacter sp. L77]
MDVVVLALRVLLSLGVVLALLFVLHRKVSKLNGNRAGAGLVSVVARQGLGAKASLVVVDAEGTRFYLGVTEQAVSVLHSAVAPRALQAVPAADDAVPPRAVQSASSGPATSVPSRAVQSGAPGPAISSAPEPDADFAASLRLATAGNPPMPATRRAARAAQASGTVRPTAPLQGSILAPATWKQTAAFLRQGRAG